jgi:hypothetical protein
MQDPFMFAICSKGGGTGLVPMIELTPVSQNLAA